MRRPVSNPATATDERLDIIIEGLDEMLDLMRGRAAPSEGGTVGEPAEPAPPEPESAAEWQARAEPLTDEFTPEPVPSDEGPVQEQQQESVEADGAGHQAEGQGQGDEPAAEVVAHEPEPTPAPPPARRPARRATSTRRRS